jgi:type IV pilus assembly protein PilV
MHQFIPTRGFTLLEVLIAVLVFSIGLLGVAGMVLASMRGVHTAQLHTQATLQAQWIGDAMRANPGAVMAGDYNMTAPSVVSANCNVGCNPQRAAVYDMQRWGAQLARVLPAGQGTVICDVTASPLREGERAFPVGLCTITLTWSESDETQDASANVAAGTARKAQRMVWVINP